MMKLIYLFIVSFFAAGCGEIAKRRELVSDYRARSILVGKWLPIENGSPRGPIVVVPEYARGVDVSGFEISVKDHKSGAIFFLNDKYWEIGRLGFERSEELIPKNREEDIWIGNIDVQLKLISPEFDKIELFFTNDSSRRSSSSMGIYQRALR